MKILVGASAASSSSRSLRFASLRFASLRSLARTYVMAMTMTSAVQKTAFAK
jgi:hypothetical protein